MIPQVAYILFLHVLGCLFGLTVTRGRERWFIHLSGFFWGLLLWVVWGLIILGLRIPYTSPVMFGGLSIAAAALFVSLVHHRLCGGRDITHLMISTLAVSILAMLSVGRDVSVLSYDSFVQILLGQQLAQFGGFDPAAHPALASWGVFVPAVQSAAIFLGVDFIYAVWPVMSAIFLFCFFYLVFLGLRRLDVHAALAAVFALLGTLFMATTYFIVFQSFYVHNNLPSAIYLFLAVTCLWFGVQKSESHWLFLSMAAFLAVILLRTEAPLFAVVFSAPLLWTDSVERRARMWCLAPLFAITLLWYSCLVLLMGSGTDILSPTKAIGLMAIMAALVAVAALPDRQIFRKWMKFIPWIMLGGSAIMLVLVMARSPKHMEASLQAFGANLFISGRWGAAWGTLASLVVLSWGLPRFTRQDCWTVGSFVFVSLIYILGLFREHPYRIGWGDSANRLMTEAVPLIVAYLVLRFGAAPRMTVVATNPAGLRRSMTAGLAVVVILFGVVAAHRPVNHSSAAILLHQPEPVPGYSFDVALRGIVDSRYSAAMSAGPAVLEFDLGRPLHADRLEMTDYAETEALTDFAWQVSPDLKLWLPVYDSRDNETDRRMNVDSVTSRYRLTNLPSFRYVRLTFRASKGQNRLLLRSLRIYATPWSDLLRRFRR